jgi:hypothetical protein
MGKSVISLLLDPLQLVHAIVEEVRAMRRLVRCRGIYENVIPDVADSEKSQINEAESVEEK